MILECIQCGENRVENRETGLCASCAAAIRKAERRQVKEKKPINKMSAKQPIALSEYTIKRKQFLSKHSRCAVYPGLQSEEIHHQIGKQGYADEWARERGIPLLLDERYWLAVSRKAHNKITEDSAWAVQNGYSLLRTAKIITKGIAI